MRLRWLAARKILRCRNQGESCTKGAKVLGNEKNGILSRKGKSF